MEEFWIATDESLMKTKKDKQEKKLICMNPISVDERGGGYIL
jgi:hypothetical protein